ncbi:hypothetical protein [Kitasatospora sp. KL5]|uniref:hypothetical protein n=1 Tax=Kitasatospora sp. KL5 TaxID=3425125 RepID=UPI003D6ED83A
MHHGGHLLGFPLQRAPRPGTPPTRPGRRAPGHSRRRERLPALRHLLAHYLARAGRHDLALEQFRLIGPWCGAYPWTRTNDPIGAFDTARAISATLSAAPRVAAA